MQLGDAWSGEPQPDSSVFGIDYYRNKVREFQTVLNGIESGYVAALTAIQSGALTKESEQELFDHLNEFGTKYYTLKATAETINAAAAAINAAGGRFPSLSIPPMALGAVPVVPLAIVGAVATAATLITWGLAWIAGLNERLRRAQLIENATPEQRQSIVDAMRKADTAQQQAQSSPMAYLADVVKYGAFVVGAYLLWRAYQTRDA